MRPGHQHGRTAFKAQALRSHQGDVQLRGPNLSNLTVDVQVVCPGPSITITEPSSMEAWRNFHICPAALRLAQHRRRSRFLSMADLRDPTGFNIGNLSGGKRLLAATAAFHVEP
jgi:hypothetical protein